MPKTALLFPGQGSQKVGMGRDLAEASAAARAVFDEADDALGFSLSQLCFEGPEDDLKLTENTQPAILTCSIAVLAAVRERGLGQADFVRLVRKRGRYMQEAVPAGEGAMAALLGMDPAKAAEVCEQAAQGQVLSAANLNSPGQVVIAGHTAAVERAVELAKPAGAIKAVLLPVSAPFHCALMRPAQERLAVDLDAIEFRDLEIPLVNNARAKIVRTAAEAREGLKEQVPNPVRWEESIRLLASEGVETFLEVGPGRVLTGLLRSIGRSLAGQAVGDIASLEKLSL
jgi:[acyl-carrier-protein] S-malonyltransferase